ncbi:CGNR zinc finger domain-containing protein [Nocardia sp. NPDC050712]|uniref:CGNR zinc finger domain-containing protein n=1 Tax=Nocardia sp. NPDC050712 TaxID=3155518 RepID=UPI0033C4EE5D
MEEPDFPILGTEPLVVEFANTRYGLDAARTDYLETPRLVAQWFAAMGIASEPDAARARALRDAVREVLSAVAQNRSPEPAAVHTVNEFAAAAPSFPVLDWPENETAHSRWQYTVDGPPAVLGRIAAECVELVTGPRGVTVRGCPAPDCTLFFLKNHSRRRWCHSSCGHRDRQARYYRRRRTPEAHS